MNIDLHYGNSQQFKYRHADINILGTFDKIPQKAFWQLNHGPKREFYVKGINPEKDRVCRNRLMHDGDFNIEISVDSPNLIEGNNHLQIAAADPESVIEATKMDFSWDPVPVALPLDLTDLSGIDNIQEIGQVVDGNFEIDREKNVIRTVEPVAKDSLFLLGSPHQSQEATYSVRLGGNDGMFLGLADFFAGHESAIPDIGIKVGWSSAGLATLRPNRDKCAQMWLAWGDLLEDDRRWAVKTDPPKPFLFEVGREYRVRQQVLFNDNTNSARFRMWPAGESEPTHWLCEESDSNVLAGMVRNQNGSFGLFQYQGRPTEWFNIRVAQLEA